MVDGVKGPTGFPTGAILDQMAQGLEDDRTLSNRSMQVRVIDPLTDNRKKIEQCVEERNLAFQEIHEARLLDTRWSNAAHLVNLVYSIASLVIGSYLISKGHPAGYLNIAAGAAFLFTAYAPIKDPWAKISATLSLGSAKVQAIFQTQLPKLAWYIATFLNIYSAFTLSPTLTYKTVIDGIETINLIARLFVECNSANASRKHILAEGKAEASKHTLSALNMENTRLLQLRYRLNSDNKTRQRNTKNTMKSLIYSPI